MAGMTLVQIQQQLRYFKPGVARLNPGASPRDIAYAETRLGVEFAPSFRRALAEFNGGYLVSEPLLGVPPIHTALDLVAVTLQARTYWGPIGWGERFLEVTTDGCGNPFALLLDRQDERGESPVGFFDAGVMQITEIVASDYLRFVWFFIQDVKWEHAPDGKPISREAILWTSKSVVVRPSALSPWRFNEAWMIANDPGLARWR